MKKKIGAHLIHEFRLHELSVTVSDMCANFFRIIYIFAFDNLYEQNIGEKGEIEV